MSKPSSPPATKKDIEDFANLIGSHCIRAERKIDDQQQHMQQWKDELRDQFQFMLDEFRRDIGQANREEMQILKDRVRNLELRLAGVL